MWICSKCKEELDASYELCWNCGTDKHGNVDEGFAEIAALESEIAINKSNDGLIASICPNCGGRSYVEVRPQAWATFTKDRICCACNTRYSPPAPLWGRVLLVVAGILLCLTGSAALGFTLLIFNDPFGMPAMLFSVPTIVVDVTFLVVGLSAIQRGWKSFVNTQVD